MLPRVPLPRPPALVGWALARVNRWAGSSVQGSRRNAMVAATALAQRRVEVGEVEAYLVSLRTPHPGAGTGDAVHAHR